MDNKKLLIFSLLVLNVYAMNSAENSKFLHFGHEEVSSSELEDRRLFGATGLFAERLAALKEYLAISSNKGKYQNLQPLIDAFRADLIALLARYQSLLASNGLQGQQGVLAEAAARALCTTLLQGATLTRLGTNVYHISTATDNWDGAQNFCQARGMYLASLETVAENDALKAELNTRFQAPSTSFWMGLNSQAAVNTWVFTGTAVTLASLPYTDWRTTPPTGTNGNRCVAYTQTVAGVAAVKWDNVNCNTGGSRYVCELPQPCANLLA